MRPFWRGPKHNDQQRSKKEQENYAGISFSVFRLRSSSFPPIDDLYNGTRKFTWRTERMGKLPPAIARRPGAGSEY